MIVVNNLMLEIEKTDVRLNKHLLTLYLYFYMPINLFPYPLSVNNETRLSESKPIGLIIHL